MSATLSDEGNQMTYNPDDLCERIRSSATAEDAALDYLRSADKLTIDAELALSAAWDELDAAIHALTNHRAELADELGVARNEEHYSHVKAR